MIDKRIRHFIEENLSRERKTNLEVRTFVKTGEVAFYRLTVKAGSKQPYKWFCRLSRARLVGL